MLTREIEADDETPCDGCGRSIPAGEPYIDEIESCCGGCYRHLCRECVLRAAALLEEKTMSDEPRTPADVAQDADAEMTLAQWVETLPPGHGARREMIALRGESEELVTVRAQRDHYAAQLARLPHGRSALVEASEAAVDRVDAVLRRILDTESSLASLVHLASRCRAELKDEFDSFPEGLDAAIEAAEKLLERRPRGMGGTAHGVSR